MCSVLCFWLVRKGRESQGAGCQRRRAIGSSGGSVLASRVTAGVPATAVVFPFASVPRPRCPVGRLRFRNGGFRERGPAGTTGKGQRRAEGGLATTTARATAAWPAKAWEHRPKGTTGRRWPLSGTRASGRWVVACRPGTVGLAGNASPWGGGGGWPGDGGADGQQAGRERGRSGRLSGTRASEGLGRHARLAVGPWRRAPVPLANNRGVLQCGERGKPPAGDGTAERPERDACRPPPRHTPGKRPKRARGPFGSRPGAPFAFSPKGKECAVPAFRPCRVVRFYALPNGFCGLANPPPDRNVGPETPPVPPRSAVPIRRGVRAVLAVCRTPPWRSWPRWQAWAERQRNARPAKPTFLSAGWCGPLAHHRRVANGGKRPKVIPPASGATRPLALRPVPPGLLGIPTFRREPRRQHGRREHFVGKRARPAAGVLPLLLLVASEGDAGQQQPAGG